MYRYKEAVYATGKLFTAALCLQGQSTIPERKIMRIPES